jgi:O-antigen ligase
LSAIFELIRKDINKEFDKIETSLFLVLLTILGVLSSFFPFYTLLGVFGFIFIFSVLLNTKKTFLVAGFFLVFQAAIIRNMMALNMPSDLINIVKRLDEFIWVTILLCLVLKRVQNNGWSFKKTYLDKPAIVFAGVGLISTLVSKNSLFWSSVAIFLALKGFLMYWMAVNLKIKKNKSIMYYKVFLYTLSITAIIGILQFLGLDILNLGISERFNIRVVHSIFRHHGVFGSFMAMGVALSFGLLISTSNKKWLVFFIIFFIALIASSVRRCLGGILVGFIVIFLYKNIEIPKVYKYTFLITLLFLSLAIPRLSTMVKATEEEYGESIAPRYWLYYGAFKIVKNKPFLGEGPGKYGSFISVLRKSEIYERYGVVISDEYKMDTYWASIIGEYGLIGTVIMLLMLILLFKCIVKGYNASPEDPFIRGLYIGYIVLFIDFLLESLVTQAFTASWRTFVMFAGVGLLNNTIENKNKTG